MSDLDRYYTPARIAYQLVDALEYDTIKNCVDPSCGNGSLLFSAEKRWPNASFSGLDVDRKAVDKIRKDRPRWIVSVGDLMSNSSLSKTHIFQKRRICDVLLLNPPFSMGKNKGLLFHGSSHRISLAMAHILTAIKIFQPTLAIGAIVPESLLFSELDEYHRNTLYRYWKIDSVSGIPTNTFKGTDVHACIITLRPIQPNKSRVTYRTLDKRLDINVKVVRGNLPVHKAMTCLGGSVDFIHSTDLKTYGSVLIRSRLNLSSLNHGCVQGSVIFLPRVGIPSLKQIQTHNLDKPVQMSDCVLGLCFSSPDIAVKAVSILRKEYSSLRELYKGTGARYLTIKRIVSWLLDLGFKATF